VRTGGPPNFVRGRRDEEAARNDANHALRASHLALCVGKKMRFSTGFARGKLFESRRRAPPAARRVDASHTTNLIYPTPVSGRSKSPAGVVG
jgi:hypothetical protein